MSRLINHFVIACLPIVTFLIVIGIPILAALMMWSMLLGSCAALWNIGIIAWSGPAAIPVAAMLWAWQWDNWTQDSVNDCQKVGVF